MSYAHAAPQQEQHPESSTDQQVEQQSYLGHDPAQDRLGNSGVLDEIPGYGDGSEWDVDEILLGLDHQLDLMKENQELGLDTFVAAARSQDEAPLHAVLLEEAVLQMLDLAFWGIGRLITGQLAGVVTSQLVKAAAEEMVSNAIDYGKAELIGKIEELPAADLQNVTPALLDGFVALQKHAIVAGWNCAKMHFIKETTELSRQPDAKASLEGLLNAFFVAATAAESRQFEACIGQWAEYCGKAFGDPDSDSFEGRFDRRFVLHVDIDPVHPKQIPELTGAAIAGLPEELRVHLVSRPLQDTGLRLHYCGDVAGYQGRVEFDVIDGRVCNDKSTVWGRAFLYERTRFESEDMWGKRGPQDTPEYDEAVLLGAQSLAGELGILTLRAAGLAVEA